MHHQFLYKVIIAHSRLCTTVPNAKLENFSLCTELIKASKVLVVPELFSAHVEGDLWLIPVTTSKEDANLLQTIFKVHNMRPLIILMLQTFKL
jgi:hypothetical protein